MQGWMEWWREKVCYLVEVPWPRYRGKHSGALLKTNVPVLAFACEPLLLCPLSLLLRACDKLGAGGGGAYQEKREWGKGFLDSGHLGEGKGFVTSRDTSLQNGGQTCFLRVSWD